MLAEATRRTPRRSRGPGARAACRRSSPATGAALAPPSRPSKRVRGRTRRRAAASSIRRDTSAPQYCRSLGSPTSSKNRSAHEASASAWCWGPAAGPKLPPTFCGAITRRSSNSRRATFEAVLTLLMLARHQAAAKSDAVGSGAVRPERYAGGFQVLNLLPRRPAAAPRSARASGAGPSWPRRRRGRPNVPKSISGSASCRPVPGQAASVSLIRPSSTQFSTLALDEERPDGVGRTGTGLS